MNLKMNRLTAFTTVPGDGPVYTMRLLLPMDCLQYCTPNTISEKLLLQIHYIYSNTVRQSRSQCRTAARGIIFRLEYYYELKTLRLLLVVRSVLRIAS